MGTIGLAFLLPTVLEMPGERADIVIQRAIELPVIAFTSAIYLTLAGKLASPRRRAAPFGIVADHPKLKRLFAWSPLVLVSAWGYSCVVEMVWPVPLNALAEAPQRAIFLALPAALPGIVYVGLASWVLAKAVRRSPSWRLSFKNVSFALAFFCWFLASMNTILQLGVASLVEDPSRTQITLAQITFQGYLAIPFLIFLVTAISLTAAPIVNENLVHKMIGRLRSQDSFEGERWLIGGSGKLRKITRATFYGSKAAEILDLPGPEVDKTATTIELAYLFSDPPEKLEEVTLAKARELLSMGREITDDEETAATLRRIIKSGSSTDKEGVAALTPLQDVLEASLVISTEHGSDQVDPTLERQLWFHLAVIATERRGGPSAQEVLSTQALESLNRRKALKAYGRARGLADSTVAQGG